MLNSLGHMNHEANMHAGITAAMLARLCKNRKHLKSSKLNKPRVAQFQDLVDQDHKVDRRSLMYHSLFTGYGDGGVVNSFDRVNKHVNNNVDEKRIPLRWDNRYQTIQKMLDDQFMNLRMELMRIAAMENPYQ